MAETAVPIATLGVEDPELRPSPRRSVAAAGDRGLGPLAHDVAAEPDPGLAFELEPEPGRLGDRGRQPGRQPGWFEGDEERLGAAGERGQPAEPVGDLGGCRPGSGRRAWGEVDHEDIDRARGEKHPRDRQALVERLGGEDDEPVEPDAAGSGLHGIERSRQVQPGDDRAVGLRLGDEPEGERGRARARRAGQRDARAPREPLARRSHDRVERGEAGPDDPLDTGPGLAGGRLGGLGWVVERLGRERRGGQRPDHPRSCGTPPRLEGRQSRRHVRGEAGHRTASIEQMFDIVNGIRWGLSRRRPRVSQNHAAAPDRRSPPPRIESHRLGGHHWRRHALELGPARRRRHRRYGFSQTDTWLRLSAVSGSPFQPAHRSLSRSPASSAIRSSSAGQT